MLFPKNMDLVTFGPSFGTIENFYIYITFLISPFDITIFSVRIFFTWFVSPIKTINITINSLPSDDNHTVASHLRNTIHGPLRATPSTNQDHRYDFMAYPTITPLNFVRFIDFTKWYSVGTKIIQNLSDGPEILLSDAGYDWHIWCTLSHWKSTIFCQ